MKHEKRIDLNRFYQTYPLIDASTGEQSKRYMWVQDRSNNDCKENIFDIENDRFVIDKWYDIVGLGPHMLLRKTHYQRDQVN